MLPSLLSIPGDLIRHRYLIAQLSWREIAGRYRGSIVGLLWSFITPLVMLGIYTLVFGVMFQARWSEGGRSAGTSEADFALILFVGLILHGLMAECLARGPGLVLGNANLVKRVVFPLEILGWTVIASALFHSLISFAILFTFQLILHGAITWTALLLPLVLLPFLLLVLGVVWFLAATGVYLRDIGQAIGPLTTVLLFLSPVLFPQSSIPEALRRFIILNPLSIPVEQARAVVIWGQMPDWRLLGIYTVVALFFAWAGAYWFRRTKRGFADVM